MNAADTLRAALDAAPGLFVVRGHDGTPALWREREPGDEYPRSLIFATDNSVPAPDLRLIGLLLEAAPHLADLLDVLETNLPDLTPYRRAADAITEAGESL